MKKKKQHKIDSVKETVKVAQAAHKKIKAPEGIKLDPEEKKFFNDIVKEMAKIEWSEHRLQLAALLAKMMKSLQEAQEDLNTNGVSIKTPRGMIVVNPALHAVSKLSQVITTMRRSLSIHAMANSQTPAIGDRRAKAKAIENSVSLSSDDDDGLLGSPDDEDDIDEEDDETDLA